MRGKKDPHIFFSSWPFQGQFSCPPLSAFSLQCAKQSVPVCEVRRVVDFEFEVMEVVMLSSSVETKRHQSMWRPGEFISWVSLDGQIDVSDVEEHLCERVAVQERRVQFCEEAEAQHLPDTGVFCCQREGGSVEVVLPVEATVKPGHLVMEHMPQKVLRVEEEEAGQYILNNSQHVRRQWRRRRGSEVPVYNRQWENETHMVA